MKLLSTKQSNFDLHNDQKRLVKNLLTVDMSLKKYFHIKIKIIKI